MTSSINRWRPRTLVVSAFLLALTSVLWVGSTPAQPPPPNPNHDEHLYKYLKIVINVGADQFNLQRDYQGCHDLYEGSLITVKPLLSEHADLQKAIDEGLAAAKGKTTVIEKAFALRKVLDTVRAGLKGEAVPPPIVKKPIDKKPIDKKPVDKKPVDKKPVDKKPIDKKPVDKKPIDKKPVDKKKDVNGNKKGVPPSNDPAAVTGVVSFKGKPLPIGYVTFQGKNRRSFATYINADGSYNLKTRIPPGRYKVTVETAVDPKTNAPIPNAPEPPAAYRQMRTTPLTATLVSGDNKVNFELD